MYLGKGRGEEDNGGIEGMQVEKKKETHVGVGEAANPIRVFQKLLQWNVSENCFIAAKCIAYIKENYAKIGALLNRICMD